MTPRAVLGYDRSAVGDLTPNLLDLDRFAVPVERVEPLCVDGLRVDDVMGAVSCWEDGVADPSAVTRELVRRAGVDVREGVDARELDRDVLVIAAGAASAELCPELPVRPLCRQLVEVGPVPRLPKGSHRGPAGRRGPCAR